VNLWVSAATGAAEAFSRSVPAVLARAPVCTLSTLAQAFAANAKNGLIQFLGTFGWTAGKNRMNPKMGMANRERHLYHIR